MDSTPKWVVDEKGNGAYEFNGSSNVISSGSISIGTELTTCFWAKPYISTIKEMVLHGSVGGGSFELFQNSFATTLRGGGSSPAVYSMSDSLPINQWTFACASINGNQGKVYINGKLVNTGSVVTPLIINAPIHIGAYSDLRYCFNGIIDDVLIYNRVLSEDEIKYQYDMAKFKQ